MVPQELDKSHYSFSYIGTQSDKLGEAIVGMTELLENMPESSENMENAKEGIEQKIRTERLTKSRVLSEYENAQKMEIHYDIRKNLYDEVQFFDMSSLIDFHNSHIAGKNRVIMVLGDKENLDLEVLKQYGEIKFLSLEDIFGY